MKILHYALGFPPYRSGGLTKFCIDLMVQQVNEKHNVAMIWPGQMLFFSHKISIKNRKNVVVKSKSIQSYEIINPLPISYDEGIVDVSAYMKDSGENIYEEFFDKFAPEVIHIHTLMGLHKSLLIAAKKRNIRIVFTAHDFFPICPKVTMFREGTVCDCVKSCKNCAVCNATALSIGKIKILQSPLYRKLKDSVIVKKIRKHHRDGYLNDQVKHYNDANIKEMDQEYHMLRCHYYSMLRLMDIIHYNSSVTKKVYESVFNLPNNCVINITHSDIKNNKKIKNFSSKKLRIRYLGPNGKAKGFSLLKSALDGLWKIKNNFCLDIHFIPEEIAPYINVHDRYTYSDLNDIFEHTDILIAPSIWLETFGFTVLEALSYGVPVIISDTVGAKDILADGAGIIIMNITSEKLCEYINRLTVSDLESMNKVIVQNQVIMNIEDMTKLLEKKCYRCN